MPDEIKITIPPKLTSYIFLHGLFLLYSFAGVFFKQASGTTTLPGFVAYAGTAFVLLFLYAILWQQALKRIPLSAAFANKGVVVLWGMFWGYLIFREQISLPMLMGAAFICVGIVLVTRDG
ncbi:MAG: EamA family transporter [Peptococcaceae bacterium]|nr:EamA family transporter [Peptococcaceae bacterium]